jgi:hypothetical protein
LTEIISDAVRKNQPPPTLIMQFHSSGIIELGTSSFQNRCQWLNPSSLAASSNSLGSLIRERWNEKVMFHAWLVKMAKMDAASTPSMDPGNSTSQMVIVADRKPRTGTD